MYLPLERRQVTGPGADLDALSGIYTEAFPAAERVEYAEMLSGPPGRVLTLWCRAGVPAAMSYVLMDREFMYIWYLAVAAEFRGQGIGRAVLAALRAGREGRRMALHSEDPAEPGITNAAQRQARMRFYAHAGFSRCGSGNCWRGTRFELLSCGGRVSEAELLPFFCSFE